MLPMWLPGPKTWVAGSCRAPNDLAGARYPAKQPRIPNAPQMSNMDTRAIIPDTDPKCTPLKRETAIC